MKWEIKIQIVLWQLKWKQTLAQIYDSKEVECEQIETLSEKKKKNSNIEVQILLLVWNIFKNIHVLNHITVVV